MLKLPRLLRLRKILKFLDNMEGANIIRMIRLLLMYFMVSHWVGCFWYFLAEYAHTD